MSIATGEAASFSDSDNSNEIWLKAGTRVVVHLWQDGQNVTPQRTERATKLPRLLNRISGELMGDVVLGPDGQPTGNTLVRQDTDYPGALGVPYVVPNAPITVGVGYDARVPASHEILPIE